MAEPILAVLPPFSPPGRVGRGLVVPNGPLGGLVAQKEAVWPQKHDFVPCLVLSYIIPKIYARINRQKPAIRYGNKIEARVYATVRSFVILRWCLLYARSWVGAAPAIYLSLNSICKYHYISLSD